MPDVLPLASVLPTMFAVACLVALVAGGLVLRNSQRHNAAMRRVDAGVGVEYVERSRGPIRSILKRNRLAAVLAGVVAGLLLYWFMHVTFWLAAAFAFVVGAVAWIVEEFIARRAAIRVEEQLADSVDLIVAALQAGTGLVDALGVATQEARRPLRRCLEEMLNRLRLGDNPEAVFRDFARRIPLESAQLLAFTLSVHWSVGGSLAPALASVGQSTRHRIEFSRRVQSQATEGRASVIGMLCITYGLTFLMWKAYPDRVEGFLSSEVGVGLTAAVVFLEGIGLVWMTRLTRIRA